MFVYFLERKARAVLARSTTSRPYPAVVAAVAFGLTVSMSMPFAPVLIFAVLLNRARWRSIAIHCSLGSAAGALVLYLVFHHLGWAAVTAYYPDLTRSTAWIQATTWLSAYGTPALFFIAASPLPQSPALIFAAIYRLPVIDVFLALLVGKLIKYGAYAWLVSKFPAKFHQTAALGRSAR